jgi:hypothetical protein
MTIPALDGGEAELNGLARDRMLPGASRQLGNGRAQLAVPGRCSEQPADDGKAQVRPPLVNTPRVLGTSCLLWHAGAPLDGDAPMLWARPMRFDADALRMPVDRQRA